MGELITLDDAVPAINTKDTNILQVTSMTENELLVEFQRMNSVLLANLEARTYASQSADAIAKMTQTVLAVQESIIDLRRQMVNQAEEEALNERWLELLHYLSLEYMPKEIIYILAVEILHESFVTSESQFFKELRQRAICHVRRRGGRGAQVKMLEVIPREEYRIKTLRDLPGLDDVSDRDLGSHFHIAKELAPYMRKVKVKIWELIRFQN